MSSHVFISHSHQDKPLAESILLALERRNVKCWIAPRDVPPGGSYAESLLNAIEESSCFVLVYTEHVNFSGHVLREVERALKFGVNIIPIRFDDSKPSKSLDYLLATVHWLSALSTPPRFLEIENFK
jgi:TIR domain